MEKVLYQGGNDIRIVERTNKLYLRYDAGAHCPIYREDEITKEELEIILKDKDNLIQKNTTQVLIGIEKRLERRDKR